MNPRIAGIVALAGVLGWAGLIWLATRMYSTTPPTAAFDLELLLRAGREVAAGHSPYDPAMIAGAAPVAERLFYSYPPVVAQAMSLIAWLPSPVVFIAWTIGAVAGLGFVTRTLAVRLHGGVAASPRVIAITVMALAPLMFPFAIGLLFGNLDVFFPLLFGLALIGVLPHALRGDAGRSGVAVAVATLAKLHPGSMGLWYLLRSRQPGATAVQRTLLAIAGTLIVVLIIDVAVFWPQWVDYAAIVRAGSGADLVDPRNAGPAAQVAMLLVGSGSDADSLARTLQIPVALIALVVTAVAGIRLADPVESLAWATAASLVVLPVTWYHYPSALIPYAIAAFLRAGPASPGLADRVRPTVVAAVAIAAAAIAWLPLLYVAIGLVLVAVRLSRPSLPVAGAMPAGVAG
jgi:hypothetical protein